MYYFLRAALISVTLISNSLASELNFIRLNKDDGISHSSIRTIVQDDRGFIWIGTEDGLNRFDGFEYKHFRFQKGKKDIGNVISDMVYTKDELWIGLEGDGIVRFNTVNEKYTYLSHPDLLGNTVERLFLDSRDNLWIGASESGLYKTDLSLHDHTVLEKIEFPDFENQNVMINGITEDQLGRIWLGTSHKGIQIYQPRTKEWINLRHEPGKPNTISSDRINYLFTDSNGTIWIGTNDAGLNQYNVSSRLVRRFTHSPDDPYSLTNNHILTIFEDDTGAIWIGTDNGISLFENERFEQIIYDASDVNSISNNRVLSIFQDRSRLIWVGTFNGLNKWDPATKQFNHTLPKVSKNYTHNVITGFAQASDGKMYISTYGGGILVEPQAQESWVMYGKADGLPDERVTTVFVDRQGGIWAGTRAKGLVYKPKGSENWQIFDASAEGILPSNGVTDVIEDVNGVMWISTYQGGITRYADGDVMQFTITPSERGQLASKNVMHLFEGTNGKIFAATDKGLNIIHPETFEIETQKIGTDSSSSQNSLLHAYEDRRGNIWLGTYGAGLYLWEYKNRSAQKSIFKHFSIERGLASNLGYGITEDNIGNIWVSTGKGLSKIDVSKNMQVTNYNQSQGLQGSDFSVGAVYKDMTGQLYFGGVNGYNRFTPEKMNFSKPTPKVELLRVNVVEENYPLASQNKITLTHEDYLISFNYVALDFTAPEKNVFQYQLKGFDQDFIFAGSSRRVSYSNLPAGEYEFIVKSANIENKWSEEQLNIPVYVKPAPWKTPLAYAIYVILIGSAIILFLRNQMQRLAFEEGQRKKLEHQVAERTQELAEQNQKLQKLNADLDHAYRTDALTGINNRRFLESYLQQTLPSLVPFDAEQARYMLVMLLDIDNLKPINDAYGHAAGDATISHAASLLSAIIPENYNLIRWGGDEFLLLGMTTDKDESETLVSNLINNVNTEQFLYLDKPIALSCSAGFAHYPFDETNSKAISWDQVTMIADKAMNCAKSDSSCTWIGVTKAKREVNDLYVSDLMHCGKITDATELVELVKG